jgi:hypothetical protein
MSYLFYDIYMTSWVIILCYYKCMDTNLIDDELVAVDFDSWVSHMEEDFGGYEPDYGDLEDIKW